MTEHIYFHKYHGCGNDFVIVNNLGGQFSANMSDSLLIRAMCERRYGVGADGLIAICAHTEYAFEMVYYNSNGLQSSLCGNGARCALAFAKLQGIYSSGGETVRFLACDGEHTGCCVDEQSSTFQVGMRNVSAIHQRYNGDYFMDTGSPHVVTFVNNVDNVNIKAEGSRIRCSEEYRAIGGTNVNFVQVEENGKIRVRTYERGVENETSACGTGCVAVAIATELHKPVESCPHGASLASVSTDGTLMKHVKRKIQAQGGQLEVAFCVIFGADGPQSVCDITLRGKAQLVYEGMYYKHNVIPVCVQ